MSKITKHKKTISSKSNRRPKKGQFGYLNYQKKTTAAKALFMLAVVIAIFLAGYLTTKTRANYFSILAVLGALPAGKQIVALIMYLRAKPIKADDYAALHQINSSPFMLYECVITSREAIFPLDCVLVHKNGIFAYSSQSVDVVKAEKTIPKMLETYAVAKATVKIFTTRKPFADRAAQQTDSLTEEERDLCERIKTSILAVSL